MHRPKSPVAGRRSSGSRGRRHSKRQPGWKRSLQTLSRMAVDTPTAGEQPPELHRDIARETLNYYVVMLSQFDRPRQLQLNLYQSYRKQDRDWSKPKTVACDRQQLTSVLDPRERAACELLDIVDRHEHAFRYYQSRDQVFTLPSNALEYGLENLASTGRLMWVLDAGQYLSLDDANPLQFDGSGRWSLKVTIERHENDKGQDRVLVVPHVMRGEERLSIDQVVGVSYEGVFFTTEQLSLLDPRHVQLLHGFRQTGTIDIPARNLASLLEQVVEWSHVDLELDPHLELEHVEFQPTPKLHLKTPEQGMAMLDAEISMKYDLHEFSLADPHQYRWDKENRQLYCREPAAEQQWLDTLPTSHFRADRYASKLSLPRGDLPELVSRLTRQGWEVVADGNAMRRAGNFNIKVESGVDWFDVHATAEFGDQTVSLPELLKAKSRGQDFIVLDDGSHGILPEQWLAKFDQLSTVGEDTEDQRLRFTKSQALLLDAMLEEQEDVAYDRAFRAWCEKLNTFQGIQPQQPPQGFQGELRPYQQLGLGWLNFLNEFRLGGCLADDMGLGKTIQVLSMLEQIRQQDQRKGAARSPTLIVVPKSLVFNWVEEAARFTPKLRVLNYTGLDRATHLELLDQYDAIVTTYGTLRNDVASLREVNFRYVILDEAQAIKNPDSQAAKASRLIQADHRLAMTGTPVENHLGDLWSLFEFLNPGILGRKFGSSLGAASAEQEERLGRVAKALRPFILRRTKEEVLTELPEKTEQTLYCDMTPRQRQQYNELRDYYRQLVTGEIDKKGLAKSKMQVLEALLRLRQAACDPRLIDSNSKVHGAKIPLLIEQLQACVEDGHKALVFSQFTSMLELVREKLDSLGWNYEYLTGKTNNRRQRVQRFQEDTDCQLFLISLKAGGHGLNLTAADYVFLLDPWWNPAVEAQAVDRAHRIGQTRSVNAYRMICRDTVEDKIVQLQGSKRKLADAIISQKQSLISNLTRDDLKLLFE